MEVSPEVKAIQALLELVRVRYGPLYRLVRDTYEVEGPDGLRQRVQVPVPHWIQTGPPPERADRPPGQTDTEAAILEVLARAERPLKGRAVAQRCGRAFSGGFREVLARLRREGRIRLEEEGYWPADRDLPSDREG